MNKCDCYHLRLERRYTYHPITGQPIWNDVQVGVCWGTKETEACDCGGDRAKCDFYPEIRDKAKKEFKDIITNADNIRAMTDEELADFLDKFDSVVDNICHPGICLDGETCVGCTLKWLKQPVKE